MTMSFAAHSNHPDELHRYERRTEALAAKLHARYNGRSLLRGGLGTDDALNDEIEDMAEDFAADLSGSVASMVFTALIHPGKIEARADATERLVERRIEPKARSGKPTPELQSLIRISYAVFCLKKQIMTTV